MAEQNPLQTNQTVSTETNFLAGTETANKDALYNDLFQTNSEWEIVGKTKTERSKLEIFTNIMTFITPIIVIVALGAGLYAFIRGQEDNSLTENFQFLCPILNYDVNATEEEKKCNNAGDIKIEFDKKIETLEKNIVDKLAIYIPIKISSNNVNSKEENFIRNTYEWKVDYMQLMRDFNDVINKSKSRVVENIFCKNISIINGNSVSIQCEVYGGDIGAADDSKTLGSSRMEATRFIEELSDTTRSKFLLENPPTILSSEDATKIKDIPSIFKTKTTVTLTMKYISVNADI